MKDIILNSTAHVDDTRYPQKLFSQGSLAANLLASVGYSEHNVPLADLLCAYHQLEGDWVILNPVVWSATHNNVLITSCGFELEMDEHQLRGCFDKLAEYLATIGMTLYYHDACTWLLSTEHKAILQAKSTQYMLGQPLLSELNKIDETMYWQQFLTEIQLYFASNSSFSPINGVWVWSSSVLDKQNNKKIVTSSEYMALAHLCSNQVTELENEYSLKECDVLLLNDISDLSNKQVEQVEQINAHWYWNNTAYTVTHLPWFIRLWRRYIHAH